MKLEGVVHNGVIVPGAFGRNTSAHRAGEYCKKIYIW